MIEASLAEPHSAPDVAVARRPRPTAEGHRRPRRYELSDTVRDFLAAKYLRFEPARVEGLSSLQAIEIPALARPGEERTVERASRRHGMARTVLRGLSVGAKLFVLAATLLVFASLAFAGEARADTLLYSVDENVNGTQGQQFTFQAPGAGTLDVRMTDLDLWNTPLTASWDVWSPSRIYSVGCSPSSCQPGSGSSGGSRPSTIFDSTISTSAAGAYYAFILARAGGIFGLGEYNLSVTFEPLAPVPLPASLWLVLAGLAATAWSVRRRKSSPAWRGAIMTAVAGR